MRVKVLAASLLAVLVAAAASNGAQAPLVGKAIAVGTMQATSVHTKAGAMILEQYTVAPGGSFGWHRHGAPVAVVVQQGTLTVFDPTVASCAPFTVSKGQAFVEPAGHVHLARNDGSTPVRVYAMYLGVPKGVQTTAHAAEPSGCNA